MAYAARRSELIPKIGFGGRSSRVWLARRTRASRGSSRWKPEPVDFRGKGFGEIFGAVQGAVDRAVK